MKTYTPRINQGGNYCGHDPLMPRLALATMPELGRGGIPPVLILAMERIQEYFKRPGKLPTLNAANGSDRKQRSERREACILVMLVVFQYTDLATLTMAIPSNNTMQGLTLRFIANRAGISLKRCERAIRDLKKAGLIKVDPRAEKKADGTYKGLAAIKSLSIKLFTALGLDKKLKKERAQKSKGLSQAQKAQRKLPGSRRNLAKYTLNLNFKTDSKRQDEHLARMILARAAALKEEHPDWPAARCNQEALESL